MSGLLRASLGALRHPNSERRTEAAAVIRDLAAALGSLLPSTAGALVVAALLEDEREPYEQMLFTLLELNLRSPIPASVLAPLNEIKQVEAWEADYMQEIFENASHSASDEH